MNIRPIKTEADYRAPLREIESLMTAEPGTPEEERLDVLVTLVEVWERKHYPLDLPDPFQNPEPRQVTSRSSISSSRADDRSSRRYQRPLS